MINPKNWNDVEEFVESLPLEMRNRARSGILIWVLPDVPRASVRQAIEQVRRGIEADMAKEADGSKVRCSKLQGVTTPEVP